VFNLDKTYVVYSEEYYFSAIKFGTILRKRVYSVSYDEEEAQEVNEIMNAALQQTVDEGGLNANNEILTAFSIKTIPLDGRLSIEDAKCKVIDDDYTWGKVGKAK
jgi:hypothetical protein